MKSAKSGRGSSAYAGAVDVILHIDRPGGNFGANVRKVEALSRFEATRTELYIELTEAGYVSLGSEDDVVAAAIARVLADVLPARTRPCLTTADGRRTRRWSSAASCTTWPTAASRPRAQRSTPS